VTTNRLSRNLDSREATERTKVWQLASVLPEPDKQAGYDYRWTRVESGGAPDPRNFAAATREGWEPVRAEEQPDLALLSNPNSRFKDNIEVGVLVLTKTPKELVEQREAYYAERNADQISSVDNNYMRENDPRMPLFRERKTKVSFGRGN